MEFFTSAIDLLSKLVVGLGAGTIIFGLITLFRAHGSGNGPEEAKGWAAIVGGIGIIIVALQLIPQLKSLF